MNKKAKKNVKKTRWIVIGLVAVVTVFLITVVVYLNKGNKDQETVSKPTIALVNEDSSSTFNKKDYHFGKDFVSLVSGDTKYNWQVVSRSVADRAYADKAVDAVIYIPQDFSQDLLTLQDINPVKAQVNYKLQAIQSDLSQKILDDKITSVLKDFNQTIVKMYYSSVAENISNAQNNMNGVITNQDNVLSTLSNKVYGPFQSTNQNYSSVIALADGLKSENSAWIASQNSFTKATQSMLDSTSQTFTAQLTSLKQYFDTQRQITDTNLKNGNKGIINQSEDDQNVYFKQFDDSHTNTLNKLFDFYKQDDTTTSGVLTQLQNQVKDYNTVITVVHDNINNQIDSLIANRDQLIDSENKLYTQFFAQGNLALNNSNFDSTQISENYQTNENAREALAQKLKSSFDQSDSFSSTNYMNKLKYALSQLSWSANDYNALFTAMQKNGVDTSQYIDDLTLISSYGKASKLEPGQAKFTDAPSANGNNQTFTQQLTIKVPAGNNYQLKVTIPPDVQLTYNDTNSTVTSTEGAKIVNDGNGNLTLYNKDHTENNNGTPTSTTNTSEASFTLYYDISLGQTTRASVEYTWGINGNENISSETYTLYPANQISEYLGGTNFGSIAVLLSQIDDTANLITWIYGAPNDEVASLIGKLPSEAELDNFKGISEKSIFYLYGNIDIGTRKDKLSDKDVKKYKNSGKENIDDLIKAIKDLNTNIDVLTRNKDILAHNLPNDVFNQNITDLEDWYSTTMTSINDSFDSWKKNSTQTLELKNWEQYATDDTALYQDLAGSDALYKTISELSTSTAKSAADTAKSAQLIKDNSDEFIQMVATTKETNSSAEKLLKNTDELLNKGDESLKESKKYNSNFEKVLSNTRSQNANKNQLFDFFAQPLSIKNLTTAITSIEKRIDWRWPFVLIIGVLLGILGSMFSKMISNKKKTGIEKRE